MMSLAIVFKGPEGIVLAADSRVTVNATMQNGLNSTTLPCYYDNATKLLSVGGQSHIGFVTVGLGAIGTDKPRTAHSFLPELEQELGAERYPVDNFSNLVSKFFMKRWAEMMPRDYKADPMIFIIGGYDEKTPYGRVFEFEIPNKPDPHELMTNDFGIQIAGQKEIVSRAIMGYDLNVLPILKNELKLDDEKMNNIQRSLGNLQLSIPYQFLPLQDCVDLSIFLIRMTIQLQRWLIGIRGVGGNIDVATITRKLGFSYVQNKIIKGE